MPAIYENNGHYVCLPSHQGCACTKLGPIWVNSQQPMSRLAFEVIIQSETKSSGRGCLHFKKFIIFVCSPLCKFKIWGKSDQWLPLGRVWQYWVYFIINYLLPSWFDVRGWLSIPYSCPMYQCTKMSSFLSKCFILGIIIKVHTVNIFRQQTVLSAPSTVSYNVQQMRNSQLSCYKTCVWWRATLARLCLWGFAYY